VRPTPTIVTVLLETVATVGTELVIVTGCPDEAFELITKGVTPLVNEGSTGNVMDWLALDTTSVRVTFGAAL